MLKAPKFWYYKTDSFLSNSLYPFSLIFRLGTKIRNLISREREAKLPIICVGNIVIGGAGKTPVALKIGNMLKKAGYNPHFVSKGMVVQKKIILQLKIGTPKVLGMNLYSYQKQLLPGLDLTEIDHLNQQKNKEPIVL